MTATVIPLNNYEVPAYSRAEARKRKLKTYIGLPCKVHTQHTERDYRMGACTLCNPIARPAQHTAQTVAQPFAHNELDIEFHMEAEDPPSTLRAEMEADYNEITIRMLDKMYTVRKTFPYKRRSGFRPVSQICAKASMV